ncbi:formate/nitrite transporter family protein [Fuchsiella alkaliacetigena]|uniref:formate/nitrite transporter family protein n=1 Tax=Fuchsiella alkaliacetigena TaxID=957042 RepID=UPI00200AFB5B|nr:formate/nitrite transporter family protein [Fuchsiella alkaliacetigena]MCK8824140.1 formate/nitrite transporter family protein [Fuchsiella alkaliacetigena]
MEKNLLSPSETVDALIDAGVRKVHLSSLQMVLLGIMAGAFVAFGAYASNVASHAMVADNYGLLKFVQGAVFPVGLIIILVVGAELFTGNTLLFLSLLDKKITFEEMMKNWTLVYLGNLIGSIAFAWLVYNAGLFSTSEGLLGGFHVEIAASKTNLPFNVGFFRGILCNFAVCLAVWMGTGAKDMMGKVLAAWFPIMAFVVGGFEHSIANMYYIPAGILAKGEYAGEAAVTSAQLAQLDWMGFVNNLISTTAGNIIGGGILIGSVYWVVHKKNSKVKSPELSYQESEVMSKS